MRQFVESIGRLYKDGKIDMAKVIALFKDGKITEEEKWFIINAL